MHPKTILLLLLALCQLGQRFLCQLTTAGYMYKIITGQDNDDNVSASAKFTAYFDCWQDGSCLYVAKEKGSGTFVLKKAGEMLNKDKYSAVWKKNTIDIDECLSSPCQNGMCTDRESGYDCTCNPGFNGTHCENDINQCLSKPCRNGGTCINFVNRYSCQCAAGFKGINCEVKDSCASNPCQFYQRCVNGVNNYSCETLTNVALYKNATQSSTHKNWAGAFIADYAVDGISNTGIYEMSCTSTATSQNPWWEVDLGKVYNITGVEITNRGDCCGERLKNFTVTVDNSLCFSRSEQIPQGATVKLPCSSMVKGQRLKIQLQYREILTLCEVKAFTPDPVKKCSSNPCQNSGACADNIADYKCTCLHGFTGKNCEIDIDECKNLPCFNGANCTNQIGNYTCSCAPGYLGRNCERSQFVLYQEFLTWENARQKCIERGGDLASIGTAVELGIVTDFFAVSAADRFIWVGLNDIAMEGQYVWSDGTTQVFPQWQAAEPNGGRQENCCFYWFTSGRLFDTACSKLLNYICKFK